VKPHEKRQREEKTYRVEQSPLALTGFGCSFLEKAAPKTVILGC
jgi:hypothetical protein